MTTILKIGTGEEVATYSCSPREAVICAHAQFNLKDNNTCYYQKRYGDLPEESKFGFSLGGFWAKK